MRGGVAKGRVKAIGVVCGRVGGVCQDILTCFYSVMTSLGTTLREVGKWKLKRHKDVVEARRAVTKPVLSLLFCGFVRGRANLTT